MPTIHLPPSWRLPERDSTPESVFWNRREVLSALGLGTAALALPGSLACAANPPVGLLDPAVGARFADKFPAPRSEAYSLGDRKLTPADLAAKHNNFYEFTTDKARVWKLARGYQVDPWKVEIGGLVKAPKTLGLEDLFTRFPLEERLYRFRCVERWAMQVPWTGFPLRLLLDWAEPLGSATHVQLTTVLDKKGMPGMREASYYPWPYFEALRLDEARHDLAFLVVGSYGKPMPMQHGAPVRLAVPWKYGYKSPKSIVRIDFVDRQPSTFWNDLQPQEYGFYSNVDPAKPHPRWSQELETDIGTAETRQTLPFNGYAAEVGSLYRGGEH